MFLIPKSKRNRERTSFYCILQRVLNYLEKTRLSRRRVIWRHTGEKAWNFIINQYSLVFLISEAESDRRVTVYVCIIFIFFDSIKRLVH